ncbi:MAG: proton-conducting transporter membrane subunit [Chloroflexota bacterium]
MVAAVGIGAYVAAMFHLVTHAVFKALLFLGSGSLIHGVEHGEHHAHEHAHGHGHDDHHDEHADDHGHDDHEHAFDPQDMRNMGGLMHKMPITFVTFTIGGLSLAGFPLITAGFWSKDEILADAWLGITHGYLPQFFVFVMLATAAFLTAFYTTRQIGLTFFGEPRSEAAEHATLGEPVVNITMVTPLVILSFFAVFAGFVGVPPDFPVFGWFYAVNPFFEFVNSSLLHPIPKPKFVDIWPAVLTSFAVAFGGIYLGYRMYIEKPLQKGQEDPMVKILGPLWPLLANRYYIDDLYNVVFIRPAQTISRLTADVIDRGVIDGFLHLIARVFTWLGDFAKDFNYWLIDGFGDAIPDGVGLFGQWFRRIQTGRIQQYLLLVAIAIVLIAAIFALSTGMLAQAAPF